MVIKPLNENRIFETEQLNNKIKCVYCVDTELDKSIISVAIKIGSIANPKEYQGLAHFLEHMLFLGSGKYPEEDAYEKAVKKYGGTSNAYTDSFQTVYYFSVFNDGINELMDIFSHFFIDPLFAEDAVNREINAVNSEHQKNINSDNWREFQMLKNLAKKNNQYNTFPTGSLETLNKPNLRERMIEFWEKYYTTANMGISFISNLSIEKQKALIKKTFGQIKERKSEKFSIMKPIYDNNHKTFQMIPLTDTQEINYIWEIPSYNIESNQMIKDEKIFEIFGSLLTTYQKGSLVNHLKIEGLIESINTELLPEGVFLLNIKLTKNGLERIKEVDGKLKYTFEHILNNIQWPDVINYYKKVYQLTFDYSSKKDSLDLATLLSTNLHYYPLDEVFSAPHIIKEINKDEIDLIRQMLPNYFKVLIADKELKNPNIDPNYGTKYKEINNIDSEIIPFDLNIDLTNEFLDMKPGLIKDLDCYKKPVLIKDKTWYGGCSKFNETTVHGSLIFYNTKFYETAKKFILTSLATNCLAFCINQDLFNINFLNYDVYVRTVPTYNAISIDYLTQNDPEKLNKYIELSINVITNSDIPDKIIESKIELLKSSYKNIEKENPWSYLSYYFSAHISSTEYFANELLNELDKLSIQEVKDYIKDLLTGSTLKMFFYGNLENTTLPSMTFFNQFLTNQEVPFSEIKFPNDDLIIQHPNIEEKSSCLSCVYPIGPFNPKIWINGFMVYLILEQPFFDELRTKKQLGYLVRFLIGNSADNYYMVQKIQSHLKPDEILEHVNEFNKKINKYIDDCNLKEWKISAKNYLEEKENNQSELYSKYFSEIINRKYLFNRNKLILNQLPTVSKKTLHDFVNTYLLDNNKKICIKLEPQHS